MRYDLANYFMTENHAWDDLLTRHKSEIPGLKTKLGDILNQKKVVGEDTRAGVDLLCFEMTHHEESMGRIRESLSLHQQYLSSKSLEDLSCDVDSLSRQNSLREEIRNAQRTFSNLKSEMLNYLSVIA